MMFQIITGVLPILAERKSLVSLYSSSKYFTAIKMCKAMVNLVETCIDPPKKIISNLHYAPDGTPTTDSIAFVSLSQALSTYYKLCLHHLPRSKKP